MQCINDRDIKYKYKYQICKKKKCGHFDHRRRVNALRKRPMRKRFLPPPPGTRVPHWDPPLSQRARDPLR